MRAGAKDIIKVNPEHASKNSAQKSIQKIPKLNITKIQEENNEDDQDQNFDNK